MPNNTRGKLKKANREAQNDLRRACAKTGYCADTYNDVVPELHADFITVKIILSVLCQELKRLELLQ